MTSTDDSAQELAKRGLAGDVLPAHERWDTGDIVLAANGDLWQRATPEDIAKGWAWSYVSESVQGIREGSVEDAHPLRPLYLLVHDGRPVCPHTGDSPDVTA